MRETTKNFHVRFQVDGVWWTVHIKAANLGLDGREYMDVLSAISDEGEGRVGGEFEKWVHSRKQSGDFWLAVVCQIKAQALGVAASPMAEA